ncbi:hypothetical protein [Neobacillus sp. OS1-33]|uniref:hypothetical protein n=1 Tax=Neobacillus sp. OS1-33 TaxID=3070683 RepID=UPI0027E0AECB|nr:hypothetical protein [Neobacillus sp. OS1-33]WML26295.1 hypothetical protein RCG22_01215 [Neobacillus sp. OS1-33]
MYVGRLHGPQNPLEESWSKEIDLAERLLIFVHKPAYYSYSEIGVTTEIFFQSYLVLGRQVY